MRPHLLLNLVLLAASEPQSSQSQDEAPACSRLEKQTRLRPRDGAAWARLAHCEQQEEHLEKARHAHFLAIRWGNERTRKNAYMRLWRMQQVVELPERQDGTRFIGPGDEPPPPGCVALRAAPELECTAEVRACAYGAPGVGVRGAVGNTYVKLEPCQGPCELRLRPPEISHPEHLDAEEKRSFEGNRIRLYRYDPETRCSEFMGQEICGEAGDSQSCDIVSVDPCNRRVGYVCSAEQAGEPPRVWAAEKLLDSVDCPDEPPSKHAPVCDEARLKRAEQQAREFARNERFECERKRLERLQRECLATYDGGHRERLLKLLADNAFRRGDFSRCRALLQDARPSEPSRLEAWGESLGRCGGDCSGQGVPDSCRQSFEVYEMLTSVEPEPCEIAGHTSARRVWNLAKTEAVYSCLELIPASPCFQVQLVQQRRDGSVSTRLFELPSERPPGVPPLECCRPPAWALESFNQSVRLVLNYLPSSDCPRARSWAAWLTWDGEKLLWNGY